MIDSRSKQLHDILGHPVIAVSADIENLLGNIQGVTTDRKFGLNNVLALGVEETIWSPGGRFVPLAPGTEELLSVVSTVAADTLAGTGAQIIHASGVDANFLEVEEFIQLNGVTPVLSTVKFFMVNHARISQAGTGRKNAGAITLSSSPSATTQAHVPAGYSTTQQMIYCVPAGKKVIIQKFTVSSTKMAGGALPVIELRVNEFGYGPNASHFGTDAVIYQETFDTAVVNEVAGGDVARILFEEGEIIEWTAQSDTTGALAVGHVSILLIDT